MSAWITVEDCLKGRALAVEREQERIIKLLEEKLAKMKFQEPNSDLEEHELLYDGLIALIKGENK